MKKGIAFGVVLIVACAACDKGKDGAPPAATTAPASTAAAATTAATQPGAVAAPTKPATLPGGRSAVPSLDEYAAAREVTVKGSSALGCETKMVREWLRVSCRGKNDKGGTPTTVQVTAGGRGETLTFASGGVTSIVTPVVDGTHVEVLFSWTDGSHKLVVDWPHGAPQPPVFGVFEGAASPLDPKK